MSRPITPRELERFFPNATKSAKLRNAANSAGGAPSSSVVEQTVCDDTLGEARREACYARRIRIRITSFRRRLLDPDNLVAKYFIDGLRYAGLIPDDREEDIALEVQQVKVKSKTSERTLIELL